jgi:hypothetical protein
MYLFFKEAHPRDCVSDVVYVGMWVTACASLNPKKKDYKYMYEGTLGATIPSCTCENSKLHLSAYGLL